MIGMLSLERSSAGPMPERRRVLGVSRAPPERMISLDAKTTVRQSRLSKYHISHVVSRTLLSQNLNADRFATFEDYSLNRRLYFYGKIRGHNVKEGVCRCNAVASNGGVLSHSHTSRIAGIIVQILWIYLGNAIHVYPEFIVPRIRDAHLERPGYFSRINLLANKDLTRQSRAHRLRNGQAPRILSMVGPCSRASTSRLDPIIHGR